MPNDNENGKPVQKKKSLPKFNYADDARPGMCRKTLEYISISNGDLKRRKTENPANEAKREKVNKTQRRRSIESINKSRETKRAHEDQKRVEAIRSVLKEHPDQQLKALPDGTDIDAYIKRESQPQSQSQNPGGVNPDTGGVAQSDSPQLSNRSDYYPLSRTKSKYINNIIGDQKDRDFVGEYIRQLMYAFTRSKVMNDDELSQRFGDYFNQCAENNVVPTWEEACLFTGYSINTVESWGNGSVLGFSNVTHLIVNRAKDILKSFDAKMAVDGKLNYVLYFFRAKNYYGLKDNNYNKDTSSTLLEYNDNYSIDNINNIKERYKDE